MPSRRQVLITGGARGIGAAIARGLAEDGMATVIADIRMQQAYENSGRIEDSGGRALAVEMDVRSAESVAAGIVKHERNLRTLLGNSQGPHRPTGVQFVG